jgi:hypothetical protein
LAGEKWTSLVNRGEVLMVKSLEIIEHVPYELDKPDKHTHQEKLPKTLRFVVWDSSIEITVPTNQMNFIGRSTSEDPVSINLNPHHAHILGVSRKHAVIKPTSKGIVLTDLDSTNGTLLNGMPVVSGKPYLLEHGDEIQIAGVYLTLLFD